MSQFMRASTRKKRDVMMEVALAMFMEKGYENVSVDDIIVATSTSKGTFYHYFKSKDAIISALYSKQIQLIQDWVKQPPSKVQSLEGHINRLFLDLASNIQMSPRLIRSLQALSLQNDTVKSEELQQLKVLTESLMHWLPEPKKIELLVCMYTGTILTWCNQDDANLLSMMKNNLAWLWVGFVLKNLMHR